MGRPDVARQVSQAWVDEQRSPKSVVGGLGAGNRRKGGGSERITGRSI